MSRPSRVRAIGLFALLGAAGCQDYNFNPVGHCVIQPGTERVKLSNISTADVLFVIDDSGSMGGEQQEIADNFAVFVNALNQTNVNRVADGQLPIDFHLAVTTTSVFMNGSTGAVCREDCPNADADAVCCDMSGSTPTGPRRVPEKCDGPGDGCLAGECRNDCLSFLGEYVCCDGTTKIPAHTQQVACTAVGDPCGDLRTHYRFQSGCTPGSALGQNERPYPEGTFVGLNANPRVIHFDKQLYSCATPPCTVNRQGYTSAQLQTYFRQNVVVGTCGSGQEQGLRAAVRALEKATSGEQWDPVDLTGNPAEPDEPAEWLHPHLPSGEPTSKVVLVFVGDEDDCSSPADPNLGVVLSGNPGSDSCVADADKPPEQRKQYSVASLVDGIVELADGRPIGAAFIVSARSGGTDVCQDEACVPGICCDHVCTGSASVCTTNVCGGQASGTRLLQAAGALRARGADVVAGSVCDPNFDQILIRIAEIVKPPSGLMLPTQPATEEITLVRIAGPDGKTRKTCTGPAPASMNAAEARAAGYDWWFTATREQVTEAQQDPTGVSRFIYINHDTDNCEASPGETYSADYLGRLPNAGCSGATAEEADASCVNALGGRAGDWTCYAGVDGSDRCVVPDGTTPPGGVPFVGTCICGVRHIPPPTGSPAGTLGGGNCPSGCAPGQDGYCPTVPTPPPPPP